jgi:hypothetical protein
LQIKKYLFVNLGVSGVVKTGLNFMRMQSLLLEDFITIVPDPANRHIREIYDSPFRPAYSPLYFEGWEYDEPYGCYIDCTEERNMIWFGAYSYFINGDELRWPPTLKEG